jgi:hypothetical protein
VKWFEKKTECPLCRYSYSDQIKEMLGDIRQEDGNNLGEELRSVSEENIED